MRNTHVALVNIMNPFWTALPTLLSGFFAWVVFWFANDETQNPDFVKFDETLGEVLTLVRPQTEWAAYRKAFDLCWLEKRVNQKRMLRPYLIWIGWSAFGSGLILGVVGAGILQNEFIREFGLRYMVLVAGAVACVDKMASEMLKRKLAAIKRRARP